MKIEQVPIGTEIKCNCATAKVVAHGQMGTRVNVTKMPELSGFVFGLQIWSSQTDVKIKDKQ